MLHNVSVGRWSLTAYQDIVPDRILDGLREQAKALRGARILHVNATAYGGGVSELLRSRCRCCAISAWLWTGR